MKTFRDWFLCVRVWENKCTTIEIQERVYFYFSLFRSNTNRPQLVEVMSEETKFVFIKNANQEHRKISFYVKTGTKEDGDIFRRPLKPLGLCLTKVSASFGST